MSNIWLASISLTAVMVACAAARAEPSHPGCPQPVTDAISRRLPGSTIAACKAAHDHGHDLFEVKVTKADHATLEIDVAPDGAILQIEEPVTLDQIPAAVMKAFAAKYPKAKVTGAEKQTPTEGAVCYELAFATAHGRKEATFTQDGTFVEEE